MFHRREFLNKTAKIAATVGTAPYFLTNSLAKAAEPKNDRLNVAAIGVGGRGSMIARWASELGDMVACCDVDRQHAERFAGAMDERASLVP